VEAFFLGVQRLFQRSKNLLIFSLDAMPVERIPILSMSLPLDW